MTTDTAGANGQDHPAVTGMLGAGMLQFRDLALLGRQALFKFIDHPAILGGSLAGAQVIWAWGDLLNGLMAIPNLIAIAILAAEVARSLREKSPA